MKKQLYLFAAALLLLCIVFIPQARAQIKKGDILLGGGLSFNTSSAGSANGKQTGIYLAPVVGKAIQDNLVLGLNLTYQHFRSSGGYNDYSSTSDSYGAGIFLRRYKPLAGGFSAYIEGDLGGSYTRQDVHNPPGSGSSTKTRGYNINAHLDAGIAYAVTKRVQVETGFMGLVNTTYSHSRTDYFDSGTPGAVAHGSGGTFNLGTNLNNALQNFIVGFRILI